MLECTETVTLIHHEKGVDGDTYICTTFEGASWYKRNTITTSGDGAKPVNTYEARIMTSEDIGASLGDYLARGKVESVYKPSDLAGLDKFRITAIGDNRRGPLSHWRFSGQ
jgi:hypothetical protein